MPRRDSPSIAYDAYAHHARLLMLKHHKKDSETLPNGPLPVPPIVSMGNDGAFRPEIQATDEVKDDFSKPVGILGAGPGGLYAALMLEERGIPYQILEAQDHVGGRLFTYTFPNDHGAPYNYYDVGAMRFPKTSSMNRVFELFQYPPLNKGDDPLRKRVVPYYFSNENALLSFNDITIARKDLPPNQDDAFGAKAVIWDVNTETAQKYIAAGSEAIVQDAIAPFARGILKDIETGGTTGWDYLMKYDGHSARSFLSFVYEPSPELGLPPGPLPTDVVNWCETFGDSSGAFDRAFSETVLDSIAFGYNPDPNAPPTEWFCLNGGAQQLAEYMKNYIVSQKPNAFTFNARVTSIALSDDKQSMDVVTNGDTLYQFSHVISTLPLPVLRTIELRGAEMSSMQTNALRQLDYGPSVKIGMQFWTAWWKTAVNKEGKQLNIVGGQSYTDTSLRTVVYPSFGDSLGGKTTTLIASYSWTGDAERLGALVDKDNAFLTDLVLRELAFIHKLEYSFLKDQLIDMHAWSWSHDPYTMGAFAYFLPGKFGSLYTSMNMYAAEGRLHFAGEALSVRHAWVEGALDSAWRAVTELLMMPGFEKYREGFAANWGVNAEWLRDAPQIKQPVESAPEEGGDNKEAPEEDGDQGKAPTMPHREAPQHTPSVFDLGDSLLYQHIAWTSHNSEVPVA